MRNVMRNKGIESLRTTGGVDGNRNVGKHQKTISKSLRQWKRQHNPEREIYLTIRELLTSIRERENSCDFYA